MHTVVYHGLPNPFGKSNEPQSEHTPHFNNFCVLHQTFFRVIRIPTSKIPNFFVYVLQDLGYASTWPLRPVRPIFKVNRASKRAYPSFHRFSCAISNHFLGYPDSDVNNANFFCGHPSRPCLCSRLAITANLTHFHGQTSLEASIPLILMIFVCYSTPFFGWSGFRRQECQNLSWTFVKTFYMHTIVHHGLSDPFGMSNEPRSEHTPHINDFHVL